MYVLNNLLTGFRRKRFFEGTRYKYFAKILSTGYHHFHILEMDKTTPILHMTPCKTPEEPKGKLEGQKSTAKKGNADSGLESLVRPLIRGILDSF